MWEEGAYFRDLASPEKISRAQLDYCQTIFLLKTNNFTCNLRVPWRPHGQNGCLICERLLVRSRQRLHRFVLCKSIYLFHFNINLNSD